jgi:alpha-amylase
VQGRGRTVAFARYLESRGKVRPGHLLAQYLSSHDVEGALSQLGGDVARFKLAAALELTVSGIPVIFYGEEVGRSIGKGPANRSDMPWGDRAVRPGAGVPRDEGLRRWYQGLIAVRKAHPALGHGTHRTISSEGDLLVFAREDAASGDAVVVAVNRGDAPLEVTVDRPAGWGSAAARDALACGATAADDGPGRARLQVPARSAAIFAKYGP